MKKLITVFVGIGNLPSEDVEETIKSAIKSYRSIFPDDSKFSILGLPDRTSKGTRVQIDSLDPFDVLTKFGIDMGSDDKVIVSISIPLGDYPFEKSKEYLEKQQVMFDRKAENMHYVVLPDRSGKGPRVQVDFI